MLVVRLAAGAALERGLYEVCETIPSFLVLIFSDKDLDCLLCQKIPSKCLNLKASLREHLHSTWEKPLAPTQPCERSAPSLTSALLSQPRTAVALLPQGHRAR